MEIKSVLILLIGPFPKWQSLHLLAPLSTEQKHLPSRLNQNHTRPLGAHRPSQAPSPVPLHRLRGWSASFCSPFENDYSFFFFSDFFYDDRFIQIPFVYHTIFPLNSMISSIFTEFHSHHHNQFWSIFILYHLAVNLLSLINWAPGSHATNPILCISAHSDHFM